MPATAVQKGWWATQENSTKNQDSIMEIADFSKIVPQWLQRNNSQKLFQIELPAIQKEIFSSENMLAHPSIPKQNENSEPSAADILTVAMALEELSGLDKKRKLETEEAPSAFISGPLSPGSSSGDDKAPKKKRRKRDEIDRQFKCNINGCSKSYGSEGALKTHQKIKHTEATNGHSSNISLAGSKSPSPLSKDITSKQIPSPFSPLSSSSSFELPVISKVAIPLNPTPSTFKLQPFTSWSPMSFPLILNSGLKV